MTLQSIVHSLANYTTISDNFHDPYFVADFIIVSFLILAISGLICWKTRRNTVYIGFGILDSLFVFSLILNLDYLTYVSIALFIAFIIICIFINSGIIRKYINSALKPTTTKSNKNLSYDKEKLITDICTAVKNLSEKRIGALITFEKTTPLDDFMKNGTIINCPVTPEIIETIFYEGTRLHDGAIIIRGNTIIAAGVYFQNTTKAVVGKFGARHRAALGFSELVSDSVTVVVSEETGHVSIAHNGIMDNVKLMEFEKIFRNRITG